MKSSTVLVQKVILPHVLCVPGNELVCAWASLVSFQSWKNLAKTWFGRLQQPWLGSDVDNSVKIFVKNLATISNQFPNNLISHHSWARNLKKHFHQSTISLFLFLKFTFIAYLDATGRLYEQSTARISCIFHCFSSIFHCWRIDWATERPTGITRLNWEGLNWVDL